MFPEGTKGPSKTYQDRYQLRRFGRGGFVEIAMRAGVPIVPIVCIGAEESMPIVFRLPSVAKALGIPYMPVTANMLLLGPLGIRRILPFEVQAPSARPCQVRLAEWPGEVLEEPDHGRGGKHTNAHARDDLRHVARAPQRLVRLTSWDAGSS